MHALSFIFQLCVDRNCTWLRFFLNPDVFILVLYVTCIPKFVSKKKNWVQLLKSILQHCSKDVARASFRAWTAWWCILFFLSTCIVIKSMLGEPINSIPLNINLGNYWTRQNVTLSKGTWFKLQVSLNILRQNEICADDLCTKHAKTQLVRMSDIF